MSPTKYLPREEARIDFLVPTFFELPMRLKQRFKSQCAEKGLTMKIQIIDMMEVWCDACEEERSHRGLPEIL